MRLFTFGTSLFLAFATTAQADVTMRFIEGAPKDRFVLTSNCALGATEVTIDMASSAAGLIFDTTGAGAGVQVFQPLEFVSGQNALTTVPEVKDGDARVTLSLKALTLDQTVAFTIDVDDTLNASDRGQIIVTGSEIEGALLTVGAQSAEFDNRGMAIVAGKCLS